MHRWWYPALWQSYGLELCPGPREAAEPHDLPTLASVCTRVSVHLKNPLQQISAMMNDLPSLVPIEFVVFVSGKSRNTGVICTI